ncbi:MAG TPA: hypothetical protein VIU38_14040 [Anaerolineales bacterium]
MKRPNTLSWIAVAVFLVGVAYDLGLQALNRSYARDGVYFHPWSSEVMMQTVPIEDLRLEPLTTLAYIHIQPPGFDFIRAALAQLWPALEIHEVLKRVDAGIYVLYALLFGIMGSLVFLWIAHRGGVVLGLLGAALLYVHPAMAYYATFLDSTFLSALLILWLYFLLWRLKQGHPVPGILLAAAFLALFFTRSIFQWPSLLVLALALFLLGLPRKQLLIFLLVSLSISGLFLAKQLRLFHTFSTTTFTGYNLAHSIGVGPDAATYSAYLPEQQNVTATYGKLPSVLVRKTKLDGLRNFNNIAYLELNAQLLEEYKSKLLTMPVGELARTYAENVAIYFQPSTEYRDSNVIVERLPWKKPYNAVFSAPVLPVLLAAALLIGLLDAIQSRSLKPALGFALPAVYIFLSSVLFEKSENMRFKFWLEPVMYVLIFSQLLLLARWAERRLRRRIL